MKTDEINENQKQETQTAQTESAEHSFEEFDKLIQAEGLTPEATPDDVFPVPTGEKGINNPARIIFSSIAGDHEWFTQNDRVVEKAESFDDKGGRRIILKELTPERAVSELERLAAKHGKKVKKWEVRKDKDSNSVRRYWRAAMMPQNTMKILLETTEARTHLPRITTITSAPLLVEDGKGGVKVLGHGYHPQAGGVFVDCEAEIPEVPLQAAADSLIALHGDFDFCTPADLSRAIGVSLSPALKTFIEDDFPMHVSEAVESQSGKDYLQKVHLRIYAESAMGITKSKGGVGSLDESIFNAILTGRRFLCIGNLRGELDSQVMEDAIRGHRFIQGRGYRMAGTVDTKPLIWQLSTNGAQFTRDIANRSIVTRIRKRASGYKFREYPEGDLLGHIKTNQAYYLGCVFAVIREWVSKGKLKTNDSRHDFRGWCQAVDWIVRNIFHLPPLLDGHKEQLDRTANPDLQWLRDVSNAILNLDQGGSMFTAGGIGAICTEEGLSLPGMRKGSDEKIELVIGRIMGRVFKNHATKVDDEFSRIEVDGNLIIRQSREEYNEQERKNRLAHSYQFTRATPAAAQNSTPTPTPSAACAPVRHGAPKDTETIRTSSVSVCIPENSPSHAAQAHRESPLLAGGTHGEVPAEVPKEVPTPLINTPRILAVPYPPVEEKELRRRWAVSIIRLKTMTVVPEWFEDPAELEMQGQNLIVIVNLSPETDAEFSVRQGDLGAGVEECWLATTDQKISVSIVYMERPEPLPQPATITSGTSTGAPSTKDRWFAVLAKITERHPLKSQWLSQWQRITLEGNVLKVIVPLNHESLLRTPVAMDHVALIVKLWAELFGEVIEVRLEAETSIGRTQGGDGSSDFTVKPATGVHDQRGQRQSVPGTVSNRGMKNSRDAADCAPVSTSEAELAVIAPHAPISYNYVTSRDRLAEVAKDLARVDTPLALDVETYGQDSLDPRKGEIRTLTVARRGGCPWVIDLKATGYDLGPVGSIMADSPLVIHNALFDLGFLRAKCGFIPKGPILCTMVMSRLLSRGITNDNDLASALKRHLDIDLPKGLAKSNWGEMRLSGEQLKYAAADVVHLPGLFDALSAAHEKVSLDGVLRLETDLLPIVVEINAAGFAVDPARIKDISARAKVEEFRAVEAVQRRLGGINMASPKQLLEALRTAGEHVQSTDIKALQSLKDTELAGDIIAYRGAQKLAQQAATLLKKVNNGRIHATFDPTGTRTGRFSCKEPNLQNVARGELRECFIAPPGRLLVVCDYSQIELRMAAFIAKDERMLAAFKAGIDLHAATAAIVLGKPVAEVTKGDRQLAKAVNFGLLYGQSARGLVGYAKSSYGVELSEKRAYEIRNRFFQAYGGLQRWHRQCMTLANSPKTFEARTLVGRRRILPKGNAWLRFTDLVNTPVQGTSADAIKHALILLHGQLPERSQIVATIHDEIVVECREQDAVEVLAITKTAMLDAMKHLAEDCPVEVEGGIGATWGSAK